MPRASTLKKTPSNLPADIPKINMPFPPNMTAEEFLRNRPLSRAYFKSPNSFFIYRQQFVKQLKLENYNDQMIKVSKWASIFWSNEPNYVKQFYKDIEKDIQKLLNEQYKNEQNNPCQNICPIFIFEYPNDENKKDDNDNSTDNSFVATNVANTSDWFPIEFSESSSNENSPTIPTYTDELFFEDSTNFFPSFYPTSPVSPIYPQYDFYTNNDTLVENNNNIHSYIKLFDELHNIDDYSLLSTFMN
ncbi:hypothetical protein C1645_880306 [Glomus cerebriforme]|uniref:HMG box domain-containing protein n=1 Tax=Glomus cerebriforme TaxID=658196 RepID=A0A397SGG1_9GLOM|nr:hypothetical protein C1645_880306 [Glomus cerebriforme]